MQLVRYQYLYEKNNLYLSKPENTAYKFGLYFSKRSILYNFGCLDFIVNYFQLQKNFFYPVIPANVMIL